MHKLKGLYTALITPFNEKGDVDEEGFRQNIEFQIENRVDGLVVLPTTGETPTLTNHEKTSLIKIARKTTEGRLPLIVGTGSYSTRQTIEQTKQAEDLGADAALIVTPYYNKPTQEGIFHHFKEVACSVSIPLVLYTNPTRCGLGLELATLLRLANFPNIVGLKEVTGSFDQISTLISAFKSPFPSFKILAGDDIAAFTFMANGAQGVISVASNLIPDKMRELMHACLNSDYVHARTIHYELYPLFRALSLESNPVPIKTAMELCGMPSGKCRLPLYQMQAENTLHLQKVLDSMSINQNRLANVYG